MAVTHIGSASSDGGAASATTAGAIAVPAGAAVGDLAIAMVAVERDIIPGLTWPTAGAQPGRSEAVTATAAVLIQWKRLIAGDLGGNITGTVSTARRIAAAVTVWRGCVDPVFTSGGHVITGTGVFTGTSGTVTPTVADSVIVALFAATSALGAVRTLAWTSSPYTERADDSSTSASANAGVHIASLAVSGGAGVAQSGNTITETDRFNYFPTAAVLAPSTAIPAGWHEARLFNR